MKHKFVEVSHQILPLNGPQCTVGQNISQLLPPVALLCERSLTEQDSSTLTMSKSQSRSTRSVRETVRKFELRPLMIIRISASLSSKNVEPRWEKAIWERSEEHGLSYQMTCDCQNDHVNENDAGYTDARRFFQHSDVARKVSDTHSTIVILTGSSSIHNPASSETISDSALMWRKCA